MHTHAAGILSEGDTRAGRAMEATLPLVATPVPSLRGSRGRSLGGTSRGMAAMLLQNNREHNAVDSTCSQACAHLSDRPLHTSAGVCEGSYWLVGFPSKDS